MKDKPTSSADESFEAHGKTLPFDGPETVDAGVLECFPYEYADTPHGREMVISTTTDEFTSVCPFSGLPDFARVQIDYVPDRLCIELRSLKYYLLAYRNVGVWYEHLVNKMLEDLVRCCQPQRMTVTIACNPRGGLASSVTARHAAATLEPEPPRAP